MCVHVCLLWCQRDRTFSVVVVAPALSWNWFTTAGFQLPSGGNGQGRGLGRTALNGQGVGVG